jgi:hypothetical protein
VLFRSKSDCFREAWPVNPLAMDRTLFAEAGILVDEVIWRGWEGIRQVGLLQGGLASKTTGHGPDALRRSRNLGG